MSFSLASSAILVGIRLEKPKTSTRIQSATTLVQEHYEASHASGAFVANLYPKFAVRPQMKVHEDLFQRHKAITARWEHGIDIIAKRGKSAWDDLIREATVRFDDAVQKQGEIYDAEIIPAAKRELGDLFGLVGYPSADEWVSQWALRPIVRPVPNSGDLRLTLPAEQVEEVERELREQHRNSVKDVYHRLGDLVRKSADSLGRYGVAKGARLQAATVQDHIAEVVSALDGLNIPDEDGKRDTVLEDLGTEITNVILSQEFSDLKKDEGLRKDVAKKASALAEKIQGYA